MVNKDVYKSSKSSVTKYAKSCRAQRYEWILTVSFLYSYISFR